MWFIVCQMFTLTTTDIGRQGDKLARDACRKGEKVCGPVRRNLHEASQVGRHEADSIGEIRCSFMRDQLLGLGNESSSATWVSRFLKYIVTSTNTVVALQNIKFLLVFLGSSLLGGFTALANPLEDVLAVLVELQLGHYDFAGVNADGY